jgi:hypothetical protein
MSTTISSHKPAPRPITFRERFVTTTADGFSRATSEPKEAVISDVRIDIDEETLIVDPRAHARPRELVDLKLEALLQARVLPPGHRHSSVRHARPTAH